MEKKNKRKKKKNKQNINIKKKKINRVMDAPTYSLNQK